MIRYESFIKNKNVIFVGPSPIIIGKNFGEYIDSFDVVIRTGCGFPVQDCLQKDYGTRCDSLYVNAKFVKNYYDKRKKLFENTDLKYIIHKKIIYPENKIKNITYRIWGGFDNKLHFVKFTGLYIIEEMIKFKAKSLIITGVDFYENKKKYIDGYVTNYINDEDKSLKIHKHNAQNVYIKNLINKHNNIIIKNDRH